ncbi:DNA primase [Immundisolibacter sp.]|uniref:DNA primase n=1 Tax=Immundisolibacter sp. TaxID=1934948 RepID=UPI0035693798
MSGRIPEDFIDAVLARTDIVDVVGGRVPLKRGGRELIGRCPFHEEKTPSFTVSPQKQFYHCFGCGAHGSAIGFLMALDRLEFPEAVADLAQRLGMALPQQAMDSTDTGPPVTGLYDALRAASSFYQKQLRQHPAAADAKGYLKDRGLDGSTAARFHLGFAADEWDNLRRALGEQFSGDLLRQAGLLTGDKEPGYDRFRGRVMFPIEDRRGRVLGFGGRILGEGEPKYLNSPETPVFHKGRELYGLPNVLRHARNPDTLIVVEGYMDVVMLAQHGVDNAVAVLGTALTTEHLRAAFRVSSRLVLCFDGDNAGRRAAERALDNAFPELADGRDLRLLFLPDGEDPDSLVRRIGREAFLELTAGATPASRHLVDRLLAEVDITSIEGRARLSALAKPMLAKLPSGTYRELLGDEIGKLTGRPFGRAVAPARPIRTSASGRRPSLVQRAVLLLAHHPQLASKVDELAALVSVREPGVDFLLRLVATIRGLPQPRLDHLLEQWRDSEDGATLSRVLSSNELVPDAAIAEREMRDLVSRFAPQVKNDRLAELLHGTTPSQMDSAQRAEVLERTQELASLNRRRTNPI